MSSEQVIIAIGYSAGGQVALERFFDCTPTDHVTYVILRHLPIAHCSALKWILHKHSRLEVIEAADQMEVLSNKVYLMQADTYLTVGGGKFSLTPRLPGMVNQAVNVFFHSLAADKRFNGIGVILSGAGNDGSEGAIDLIRNGGIVIAQEPASCDHENMPQGAITATGTQWIMLPATCPLSLPGMCARNIQTSIGRKKASSEKPTSADRIAQSSVKETAAREGQEYRR